MPTDFNPKQIDPALLTFKEWYNVVDPQCKSHPDSAYDIGIKEMQASGYMKKGNFPKLLRRIRINGIYFEIRLNTRKIGKRVKTDTTGEVIRVAGEVQYYTDEEIEKLGWKQYEWMLGVFDGELAVASVQDEWGCMLVMVAREYRTFGLGRVLLKIAYGMEPDKPSGGFTAAGYQTFARIHADFVHEALRSGMYLSLIKQGKLTKERVREIIASAKPSQAKRPEVNLNSDDPNDWMLYVGDYGDFIIYDRKLRDLNDDEKMEHFRDKMIKGMVYVMQMSHNDIAYLRRFGGETSALKSFLLSCAVEFCIRENVQLYLENDEPSYLIAAMGTVEPASNKIGFSSQHVVPTGKRMDYTSMGMMERRWRKTFDRYDEFKNTILEMAYGKYQNESQ